MPNKKSPSSKKGGKSLAKKRNPATASKGKQPKVKVAAAEVIRREIDPEVVVAIGTALLIKNTAVLGPYGRVTFTERTTEPHSIKYFADPRRKAFLVARGENDGSDK